MIEIRIDLCLVRVTKEEKVDGLYHVIELTQVTSLVWPKKVTLKGSFT